jgi:hypothetical protein
VSAVPDEPDTALRDDLEALKAAAVRMQQSTTQSHMLLLSGDVLELIARIEQTETDVGRAQLRGDAWREAFDADTTKLNELRAALVREQDNADRLAVLLDVEMGKYDVDCGATDPDDPDPTLGDCELCPHVRLAIAAVTAHAECVAARPTSTATPVVAPHSPANTRQAP